jgi:hypothetical protein
MAVEQHTVGNRATETASSCDNQIDMDWVRITTDHCKAIDFRLRDSVCSLIACAYREHIHCQYSLQEERA